MLRNLGFSVFSKGHWLMASKNKELRRIFGHNKEEVTGDWRKLHNSESHNLYFSLNIVMMIKEDEMSREYNVHGGSNKYIQHFDRKIRRVEHRWECNFKTGYFDSRRGLGIFLFTTVSIRALEPTQPPIQRVPGALSLEVKCPGREADHSPPSSAVVKNEWNYTSTPQYVFMAWCLVSQL
jgi:hypothetical protein